MASHVKDDGKAPIGGSRQGERRYSAPRPLLYAHLDRKRLASRVASASAGRRRAVAPTIPDARDWHAVSQGGRAACKEKSPAGAGLKIRENQATSFVPAWCGTSMAVAQTRTSPKSEF